MSRQLNTKRAISIDKQIVKIKTINLLAIRAVLKQNNIRTLNLYLNSKQLLNILLISVMLSNFVLPAQAAEPSTTQESGIFFSQGSQTPAEQPKIANNFTDEIDGLPQLITKIAPLESSVLYSEDFNPIDDDWVFQNYAAGIDTDGNGDSYSLRVTEQTGLFSRTSWARKTVAVPASLNTLYLSYDIRRCNPSSPYGYAYTDVDGVQVYFTTQTPGSWTRNTHNISSFASDGTVTIRFRENALTGNNHCFLIDNVELSTDDILNNGNAIPIDATLDKSSCPLSSCGDKQNYTGDPINTFSGNYGHSMTDLSIASVGPALKFERNYHSLATVNETVVYSQPLGYGWTHNYDMNLNFTEEPGTAILKAPGGSRMRFTEVSPGTYEPSPGVWAEMTRQGSTAPYSYVITAANQTVYEFEDVTAAQPFAEIQKLTASDGAAGDTFGFRLALDDDTLVIGSVLDDDNGTDSGSVYVFTWNGSNWSQQAKLTADDGAAGDYFGRSLDIDGDTLIVGAPSDDDKGTNSGSVYVFTRNGSSWSQQAKLISDDSEIGDQFSFALAIDGDMIMAGALQGDDDNAANSGSVYVYTWNGSSWSQQTKLTASDAAVGDQFGRSLNFNNDTLVVGAMQDDDNGANSGSAYVFTWNGSSWSQQAKLTAGDGAAGDTFGRHVAIDGDTSVIGAPTSYNNGVDTGSTYVFTRSGSSWSQQAKLTASGGAAGDLFGRSFDIVGDTVVISAHFDDDYGTNSGSAYVFTRSGSNWSQQTKLNASDAAADDRLGRRVMLEGNTLVLPAHEDDDNGEDSGSVYVFERQQSITQTRLASIRDPQGNLTSLDYDGLNLTRVTDDASQRYLDLTYNPDGLLDTVTDHTGRSVSYGYDGNSDLVTVNDTRGLTWTYEYSGTSHLLHKVINPESETEEQTFYTVYDGLPRANLQLDGEGDTIASIQYATDGPNEIRAINEGGRVYTDTYDSRNLLISQTDALGRSQDYTLDGNFNRTNTTDIRSQPTNYERTEVGLTQAITNALSQKTRFEFDTQNNLDLVIENDGTQTDYVYDATNNLRQIGTISGTIFYSYNSFGQVISTTNRRNHTTRYGYDQIGNLRVITDAVDNTTDFTYDNLGRVETVTNARDMVTRYQYDDGDNLRFITQNEQGGACPATECNLTTEFQYDDAGRLEWVIDPANRRTKREYDNSSKVARVIVNYENGNFSDSAPDEDIITRYSYDTFGRLDATFETLAEGQERENRLIYDALNRLDSIIFNYVLGGSAPDQNLTTTYAYQDDTVPAIVTITDPTGLVTRTEYDALGRLEKRIVNYQAGTCPATECNLTTSYQYDGVGNLISMTNPQSLITNYQYDPLHRLTGVIEDVGGLNINTGFDYDNEGNLTLVTPPNLSSGQAPTTVYRYDALNRLDEMENALGHLTDYQYDPVSNLDKVIKPDTQSIDYGYDLLNRLTDIDYPVGETDVAFGYNQVGQRTSMTDDTGPTTYLYDDLDRLTEVNDGNSQIIGYRYDARGNRTRLTYPDGRYLSHSYDDADRPETITPSATWDDGNFEYAYVNNRLDTLTRPNGVVSEYDYDSANRLLAITHRATSNDLSRYSYRLDEVGNVKVVTETLVSAPSTAYPANNGQVVLEAEMGQRTNGSTHNWLLQTSLSGYTGTSYLVASLDNDTLIQPESLASSPQAAYPLGFTTPGTYTVWLRGYPANAAGDSVYVGVNDQLVTVTGFTPGQWSWANLQISSSPNLLTSQLAITQTGLTTLTLWLREDGLRLDRLLLTTDTTFIPTGLGPAATPQTVISTTLTRTIVYTYDNMYRLTEADYSTHSTSSGQAGEFFEYNYDDNGNRLSQTTLTGTNVYTYDAANRLVEVDGQSYTWDDNGNLLDDGQRSYGYDTANRLTGVTEGSNSTTFKYNGDGDRYAQIVNSVQTDYVLDPVGLAQVLAETTNSQSNFYLPGLAQYNNNSWRYFLPDRLGSVRQLIDQVSTVQLTQSFDPFGNLLRQAGTSSSSFGYTGEQVDSSGLVYLRARYYAPALGRFITKDQFPGLREYPATLNSFVYAVNNPVTFTDPSGNISPELQATINTLFNKSVNQLQPASICDLVDPCGDKLIPILPDGTLAGNLGGVGGVILGGRFNLEAAFDNRGNFALLAGGGGGGIAAAGFNAGPAITLTNAPTVDKLKDFSIQLGGFAGEGGTVGAEWVVFKDEEGNKYQGGSFSVPPSIGGNYFPGPGLVPLPFSAHLTVEHNWIFFSYNYRELIYRLFNCKK